MDEIAKCQCGCLDLDTCYEVIAHTGCWQWLRGSQGIYGMLQGKGAHVLMYEKHIGTVPTGLVLDHKCKNTECVNPSHLEPVVQAINVQRGRLAKLTAEQVAEIRRRAG